MTNQFYFPLNQHGWILLTPILGKKVTLRAVAIDKVRRTKDENDHRMDETVAEGSVKVKSRSFDTSDLIKKFSK